MANGRCKLHGGKATGAKNPNKDFGKDNPAYSHGIYTKFFRPDEKDLIDAGAIRLGEVDEELRVMRIRLKRTLEAREAWEAECRGEVDGKDEASSLVLVESEEGEKPFGKDADVMPFEAKKRKLPNYDDIIDRTVVRIESLEKTRKELLKEGGGSGEGEEGSGVSGHVTFSGGLDGNDGELPSPFKP